MNESKGLKKFKKKCLKLHFPKDNTIIVRAFVKDSMIPFMWDPISMWEIFQYSNGGLSNKIENINCFFPRCNNYLRIFKAIIGKERYHYFNYSNLDAKISIQVDGILILHNCCENNIRIIQKVKIANFYFNPCLYLLNRVFNCPLSSRSM